MVRDIKFIGDDLIGDCCYNFVESLFNVEILYLSNESDMEFLAKDYYEDFWIAKGNQILSISDHPDLVKKIGLQTIQNSRGYQEIDHRIFGIRFQYFVFPIPTIEGWNEYDRFRRLKILEIIEDKYKINMKGWPTWKPLIVWELCSFVTFLTNSQWD